MHDALNIIVEYAQWYNFIGYQLFRQIYLISMYKHIYILT